MACYIQEDTWHVTYKRIGDMLIQEDRWHVTYKRIGWHVTYKRIRDMLQEETWHVTYKRIRNMLHTRGYVKGDKETAITCPAVHSITSTLVLHTLSYFRFVSFNCSVSLENKIKMCRIHLICRSFLHVCKSWSITINHSSRRLHGIVRATHRTMCPGTHCY